MIILYNLKLHKGSFQALSGKLDDGFKTLSFYLDYQRLSSTPVPRYPDYYEVSGAPLMINGFYAQTSTFSSAAPIYRKPGVRRHRDLGPWR